MKYDFMLKVREGCFQNVSNPQPMEESVVFIGSEKKPEIVSTEQLKKDGYIIHLIIQQGRPIFIIEEIPIPPYACQEYYSWSCSIPKSDVDKVMLGGMSDERWEEDLTLKEFNEYFKECNEHYEKCNRY